MHRICFFLIIFLLVSCSAPAQTLPPTSQSERANQANPASENCAAKGGTLTIETRRDNSQYGICFFEDNRQCEEWALLNGDCPVGGFKITGYVTPASQYCAISGGIYTITGNNAMENEQGTCSFRNGSVCDVWDNYNGKCSSNQSAHPTLAVPKGGSGWLVFDSTRGGAYRDLYVMNADGSKVARLTLDDANSFAGPWSPDGQWIVFTGFGLTSSHIALIREDGTDQRIFDNMNGSDEGFPAWSPDGQQIAFTSRRDGNNEIYVMNVDGSNPFRLTEQAGDDFAPSWSPDGSQIAFVSDRDQSPGIYDLYIMNADGSEIRRLTSDTAIDYSPAWSPDGKMIAFRSHHDGPADIYLINVDGNNLRNLTNDPADDWAPSWSPDGSLIAFQTNRDGNWEIYVMNADGTQPVNLTNDLADDQLPYWQPAP
jgi:Tol biopolymer transport system component/putative hemolysin